MYCKLKRGDSETMRALPFLKASRTFITKGSSTQQSHKESQSWKDGVLFRDSCKRMTVRALSCIYLRLPVRQFVRSFIHPNHNNRNLSSVVTTPIRTASEECYFTTTTREARCRDRRVCLLD